MIAKDPSVMNEIDETIIWDGTAFKKELVDPIPDDEGIEPIPDDDIVLQGAFVEPVKYRYLRMGNDDLFLCIDSTIGFEIEVFKDPVSAISTMNYSLARILSCPQSQIDYEFGDNE